METDQFENLSKEGLTGRIEEMRAEYYVKRSAVKAGQEKNSAGLRVLRRAIARGLTVIKSRANADNQPKVA